MLPLIHFAKIIKPLSLPFPPPLSIKPPSKVLEKNKFPVGLNRGFTVSDIRLKNLLEN